MRVEVRLPPNNGLGTFALACSVLGFFLCGPLCVAGLALGLIALCQPPRSMALLAVLVGGFGTTVWFVLLGLLSA